MSLSTRPPPSSSGGSPAALASDVTQPGGGNPCQRQFDGVSAAALGAVCLTGIYAAFQWRSLFADGTWYFVRLLVRHDFALWEPARYTVHILQQFPTMAALRLGVTQPGALAVIFGLTLQLLPLLLTAACYPALPRDKKALFVFPLAHYLLGTMVAFFAPIVEGPVAAAYFWLLFVLVVFGRSGLSIAAIVCLALPAACLHEFDRAADAGSRGCRGGPRSIGAIR